MASSECVEFLQWALPHLGLRWQGFRRVRRQVCRRVGRRVQALHLPNLRAYREYINSHPEEWSTIDSMCHISISRFVRDRAIFDDLARTVLPAVATRAMSRDAWLIRSWSAGCGSGEEPNSLKMLWKIEVAPSFPSLTMTILATDVDRELLERARRGRYARSSLRELPATWIDRAFDRQGDTFVVRPEFKADVEFRRQDVRNEPPDEHFDLILCRNVAFTYFDQQTQRDTLERLLSVLRPGGGFIIGRKERLPCGGRELSDWLPKLGIFAKHDVP